MILALQIAFWTCLVLFLATYVLYPLSLLCWRRRTTQVTTADDHLPTVTLVISAYNESQVIAEKIENALNLEYPTDRLEIMVISDASDDGTDEIVQRYENRGVRLCRQTTRGGKSLALSQFVPEARGQIVVFSDANSMYRSDALRKLVAPFADPQVGFAVGHQRYVREDSQASVSESLYWQYETQIKILENRLAGVVCGDGAIYAIRRDLFVPLREDDINDFYIPLRIVCRGFRGVFEPQAVCFERTAASFQGEFRRKVRIVNRSLRAVLRVRQTLNPVRVGWFAYQLWLHKVIRWFVPYLMAAMLISSGLLWRTHPVYPVLFVGQLTGYLAAMLYVVPPLRSFKLIYVAYYFCLVNWAAAIGVASSLAGFKISTWTPERSPSRSQPAPQAGSR